MLSITGALIALTCSSPTAETSDYQVREVGISLSVDDYLSQGISYWEDVKHYLVGPAADEGGYLTTEMLVYSNTFKGKPTLRNAKRGIVRDGVLTPIDVKKLGMQKLGDNEFVVEVYSDPERPKTVYKYTLLRENRYYLFEFTSYFDGERLKAELEMAKAIVSSVQFTDIWTPSTDLATDRMAYPTRLTRQVPSPQEYGEFETPIDSERIEYASGTLALPALVSSDPKDGKQHPAVVFAHGGYAFGSSDWEDCKPYRDAGFIVMTPILRGENGAPGTFELFCGEVDDVIAAGRKLASFPYVDPERVYVAGHSIGGTNATLAAMLDSPFKKAASFGGSFNAIDTSADLGEAAPFNWHDSREIHMRSPLHYSSSLKCPLKLYYGAEEADWFESETDLFVERATKAGRTCSKQIVPGDHWGAVEPAMRSSIEFFNEVAPSAPEAK